MCEQEITDYQPDPSNPNSDSGLATQSLSQLDDLASITPLTPFVMSRQATINIGTIGHVAHGKSTVVNAISGVKTTKFHQEAVMNITIHLGYANAKIYKCPNCAKPKCYHAFKSSQSDQTVCPNVNCAAPLELQRHVSFLDCPGHEILMATMLNGAAIMDAALLLIAANETFPQPQTLEHLKAVEIMRLNNIIVLQNKIDLVKDSVAAAQYSNVKKYFRDSVGLSSPLLPISAQLRYNIDVLLEYICHLPVPTRQLNCPMRMIIVRSFDVNRPGEDIDKLQGGVAGGSVQRGVLKLGQEIEVRPGLILRKEDSSFTCAPLRTQAVSLLAEGNSMQYAIPGGLIAVGTKVDPTLTRQNKLVGHAIGDVGSLPEVYSEIEIQYNLLPQVVGLKQTAQKGGAAGSKATKIQKLGIDESLQINLCSLTTAGTVTAVQGDIVKVSLLSPVCASVGDHVAISRRMERHWRLIGWGSVRRGVSIPTEEN